MNLNQSTRRMLRFGAVASIALMTSACASQTTSSTGPTTAQANASQESETHTYYRYCDSLHKEGDLYVAVGMCRRAFEVDRTNVAALHKLGVIMTEIGNYEGAVEAYATALAVNPNDNEARYGLAKTYMEVGHFDLAAVQLKNAIAQDGNDSRYYNAMGVAHDQQGRHQQAQVFYTQGLKIDPNNVALLNNMGLSQSLGERDGQGDAMAEAPTPASNDTVQVVSAEVAPAAPVSEPIQELKTTSSAGTVVVRPKVEIKDATTASEAPDGPNEIEAAAFANEPYSSYDQAMVVENSAAEELLVDDSSAAKSKPLVTPEPDNTPEITIAGSTSGQADSTQGTVSESAAAKLPSDYLKAAETPSDEMVDDEAATAEPMIETQVAAKPMDAATTDSQNSPDRSYTVQVGSYSTPEAAFRGWEIIAEAMGDALDGYSPEVIEADAGSDKGIVYRLRTGAFTDKAESDALCSELDASGFGCFAVKLPRADDRRVVARSEATG